MFRFPFVSSIRCYLVALLLATGVCVPVQAQLPSVSVGTVMDLSDLTDPNDPSVTIQSPFVGLGRSVAVDGDYAIVGCLSPNEQGRAYLYSYGASGWTRESRLDDGLSLTDYTGFATQVSMGGGTAGILQRPYRKPTTAIHILTADYGWGPEQTITTKDWPISGVESISAWGDTVALGDPTAVDSRTGSKSGGVTVFARSSRGWVVQGQLVPSDTSGVGSFGTSVSLEGDRLLVGSPGNYIDRQVARGSVYVFERRQGIWTQSAKLIDSTGASSQKFGSSVALSGNTDLVSSPNRLYANVKGTVTSFQRNSNGTWTSNGLLPVPKADQDPNAAPPQLFGSSLSLSGSIAAIGNRTSNAATERSYLYQRRGDRWQQLSPLDGAKALSSAGGVASVSGTHFLVGGGFENSPAGFRSGVARPFDVTTGLAVFDGPTVSSPELTEDADTVTVDMGDLIVGRKVTRSFTIQNLSATAFDSFSVSSDGVDGETIVLPTATSLAVGAAATVTLSVTPPADGPWMTHITVDASGTSTSQLVITVMANAISTNDPPVMLVQPKSQVVWDEAPVEFIAEAVGTAPFTWQWSKDGKVIPGATARYLRLPSVHVANTGNYTVKVSNAAGSATSTPASLAIFSFKTDTALRVNDGASFSLTAPVTGPGVRYQWMFNGKALSDTSPYSGTKTNVLKISAASLALVGQYSVVLNPGPTQLIPQRWNITVLLKPEVQSPVNSFASLNVARSITGKILATPAATSFRFTGVPPGLLVDTHSGTISGKPNAPGLYQMTVTALNAAGASAPRVFPINVVAIDARSVGQFRGTIIRHQANSGLGGLVQLTTTAAGQCTGTLLTGTRKLPFTTTLFQSADSTAYLADIDASLSGKEQYGLRIEITTGKLSGTVVTDDLTSPTPAVNGWISPWSAINLSAQWSDYCTAAISPKNAVTDFRHVPVGSGYATVSITTGGTVTWAGRMADGSVTTLATALSPTLKNTDGTDAVDLPVFLLTSNGTGSALGTARLNQSDYSKPGYHTLTGGLDWMKLAELTTSKNRSFKDGITLHTLTVQGSGYAPPAPGQPILGLPLVAANASLTLSGSGIENAAQFNFTGLPFTINGNATAVMPAPNPLGRTTTFDRNAGTFSGSFTLTDADQLNPSVKVTRKATFYGVLLASSGSGIGFVSLPAMPDVFASPPTTTSTSPIYSAKLLLNATTQP